MFFYFQCCFPKRFTETTGNNAAGNYVSHVCDGKQALFSLGVFPIAVADGFTIFSCVYMRIRAF